MSKLIEELNTGQKPYRLGDLFDLQYGFGLPERDRKDGIVPVYGSSGVVGYHSDSAVKKSAIVIGRKGNVGSVFYTESASYPIDTAFFIDNPRKGFDLKYIYYLLNRVNLPRYGGDSAVPGLSRDAVYSIDVVVPDLVAQKKIAEILGAYDAKIENNNAIIKNLEATTQAIFNEWFVKFHFPGYKKVKMVNSELGLIPEGWGVGELSDLANVTMGQSPLSQYYNEKGEGLPFHQGVTNFGNRFPSHKIFCTVNERIAENGDILFSVRAPVGRLNIANATISLGRGLAAMKERSGRQSFLFYLLKRAVRKEDSIGGGSIFASVAKDELRGIKILIPGDSLIDKFETVAKPIDAKIGAIEDENQKLKTSRDQLLKKLI